MAIYIDNGQIRRQPARLVPLHYNAAHRNIAGFDSAPYGNQDEKAWLSDFKNHLADGIRVDWLNREFSKALSDANRNRFKIWHILNAREAYEQPTDFLNLDSFNGSQSAIGYALEHSHSSATHNMLACVSKPNAGERLKGAEKVKNIAPEQLSRWVDEGYHEYLDYMMISVAEKGVVNQLYKMISVGGNINGANGAPLEKAAGKRSIAFIRAMIALGAHPKYCSRYNDPIKAAERTEKTDVMALLESLKYGGARPKTIEVNESAGLPDHIDWVIRSSHRIEHIEPTDLHLEAKIVRSICFKKRSVTRTIHHQDGHISNLFETPFWADGNAHLVNLAHQQMTEAGYKLPRLTRLFDPVDDLRPKIKNVALKAPKNRR